MNINKKIMCLLTAFLTIINCFSIPALTSNATVSATAYTSEIQKAVKLGIVPKTMQSGYTKNVTQKELYTFLNYCIRLKTGKYNTSWLKLTNSASSKTAISRQTAAVVIYRAALILGTNIDKTQINNAIWFSGYKLNKKLVDECLKDPNISSTDIFWLSYTSVGQTLSEWPQYNFKQNGLLYDALDFVTSQSDGISGKKIMELTDDYRFRPRENMTKAEAIVAAYRLFNSIDEKAKYVKIEDAGLNTIPLSLVNKTNSKLPDATNSKLPLWKGVGITNKAAAIGALFSNEDKNFHENEIKFLSDNGFNFVRVFFSFSTLGYPDFPDNMVNEVELKELDDLVGWGIKYDVHICLCMEGQPGMAKEPFPAEIMTGDFFTNAKKQDLVKRYWQMISKRYANIPNKYLSFNLMNEPEPPSDEVNTAVFKPIVEAIWHECPNRVILADCTGCSCEGLAKMGVALSYHFYSPNVVCYNGMPFVKEEFPYLTEPQWPLVYLPSLLCSGSNCDTVTIEGNFNKGSIGFYADDTLKNTDTTLNITANDQTILNTKISDMEQSDGFKKIQKEYTADFPEGTTKLEIKVNGWLRYGRIQIKQSGKKDINMYPHDLFETDFNAISPVILVHDDGTYENNNSPKMNVDWNYLFQKVIKEHLDVAKTNNVGLLIGEFAPFGRPLPKSTLLNYMDTILSGLNSSNLPWCNGGFIGSGYLASFAPYSKDYTFTKVPDSDLYVNQDLLSVYKKYTK